MKELAKIIKESAKKMNNTMFDLASGPTLLMLIGVPLIIILAVAILIFVVVKLIKKARIKNIEAKSRPDSNDSSSTE